MEIKVKYEDNKGNFNNGGHYNLSHRLGDLLLIVQGWKVQFTLLLNIQSSHKRILTKRREYVMFSQIWFFSQWTYQLQTFLILPSNSLSIET